MITKPMLAGTVKDLKDIKYPILCTPKLDGIRALKINGKVLSRNFKPIPNKHIRDIIEKHFPDGVDGELILNKDASNPLTGCMLMDTFNKTSSAVMSEAGEPWLTYHLFDYVKDGLDKPYNERIHDLRKLFLKGELPQHNTALVLPFKVNSEKELLEYEGWALKEGYEGVIVRSLHGPYKCGRSTIREGYLLKVKRFKDSEAIIIGFEEKMHNANVAKKDELGRTKRSSHKANKIPLARLGALKVRDTKTNVEFNVGSGYDDKTREEIWCHQESCLGKTIKYKYQSSGAKDLPRFPVFIGFRHENDMSS